jgi:hypothetical protein
VDVAKMQRRAGHDTISTTLGYVKMAEDLTGSVGKPFPPLPAALLAPPEGKGGPSSRAPRQKPMGRSARLAHVCPKSENDPQKTGKTAERAGFEPSESAEFTAIRVDSRTNDPPRSDVSARELVAFGPSERQRTRSALSVDDALAVALARASAAQEWPVVAQLARELEARRLSPAGVRSSLDERGRRPGQK